MIGGKTVMKLFLDLLLFILWSMTPGKPIYFLALAPGLSYRRNYVSYVCLSQQLVKCDCINYIVMITDFQTLKMLFDQEGNFMQYEF